MKSRRASKKTLKMLMIFCFMLAGLLVAGIAADVMTADSKYDAPNPAVAQSSRYMADSIADNLVVIVLPITVLFLLYFAYQFNRLIRNLSVTVVCSHENTECGFAKKYFS